MGDGPVMTGPVAGTRVHFGGVTVGGVTLCHP